MVITSQIEEFYQKSRVKGNFYATYDSYAYSRADVVIVDINLDVDKQYDFEKNLTDYDVNLEPFKKAMHAIGENCSEDMSSVAAILSRELKTWVASSCATKEEPCRGLEKILLRSNREAFAQDARGAVTDHVCRSAAEVQATANKYASFSRHAVTFANAMARADAEFAAATW